MHFISRAIQAGCAEAWLDTRQGPNMVAARGVRDVPAEEFIKAYADHLKTNDKVCQTRTRGNFSPY
jgi:hypothetical protein